MSDLIRREDVLRLAECGKLLSGFYGERAKDIIKAIPTADNSIALLPNGELLVDTEYTDQVESVRLMNYEGFTRVFNEPKVGRWIRTGIMRSGMFGNYELLKCSLCDFKEESGIAQKFKYCPICGARMEESR